MTRPGDASPNRISKILAIRLARLGDIVLLLPSLALLKSAFGGAHLTLLTALPYEPLARMSPAVDEVVTIDRIGMRDGPWLATLGGLARLIHQLRASRFDLVVDFHSFRETNLLARASGGSLRIGMKRADRAYLPFCFNLPPVLEDKSLHVAEMFHRIVVGIPGVGEAAPDPGPAIRVPTLMRGGPQMSVALYVGASVASRRWPAARFAALAGHVASFWGASVLVLSGITPEEQAASDEIRELVVGDSGGRDSFVRDSGVRFLSRLPIPDLARAIASADFLVSNDSGPMHLGSALGVPTLGIFSESLPEHYRPTGACDRFLRRESVGDVRLEDVVEVLEEMRADVLGAGGVRRW